MLDVPRFPLGLALAGICREGGVREHAEWAAGLGYRSVQLNAGPGGLRPREMSRSARRDIASVLRRMELEVSGVDLWIPPAHFVSPAHVDRAVDAVREALAFAADMASLAGGRAVVSLELPADEGASQVVAALGDYAAASVARIADHAWPARAEGTAGAFVGVGVDAAALLLAGVDPAKEGARLGARWIAARLSDVSSVGRVEPGRGRLDLLGFLVAIGTSANVGAPVVDLRGIADQEAVARAVVERSGIERGG